MSREETWLEPCVSQGGKPADEDDAPFLSPLTAPPGVPRTVRRGATPPLRLTARHTAVCSRRLLGEHGPTRWLWEEAEQSQGWIAWDGGPQVHRGVSVPDEHRMRGHPPAAQESVLKPAPRGQGGPARWAHLDPEPAVPCRGRMRPAGVPLGSVPRPPGGQAGPSWGETLYCLPTERLCKGRLCKHYPGASICPG